VAFFLGFGREALSEAMELGPHYLKRYKDIALLFGKYGQPGMISRFGFELETESLGNDRSATPTPRNCRTILNASVRPSSRSASCFPAAQISFQTAT
jgi:hypothetical protein